MWKKAFWKTVAENAIRAAATSALGWLPVSGTVNGWEDIAWERGGIIVALSALASVLFSIGTQKATGNGPMFTAAPKGETKNDSRP